MKIYNKFFNFSQCFWRGGASFWCQIINVDKQNLISPTFLKKFGKNILDD